MPRNIEFGSGEGVGKGDMMCGGKSCYQRRKVVSTLLQVRGLEEIV